MVCGLRQALTVTENQSGIVHAGALGVSELGSPQQLSRMRCLGPTCMQQAHAAASWHTRRAHGCAGRNLGEGHGHPEVRCALAVAAVQRAGATHVSVGMRCMPRTCAERSSDEADVAGLGWQGWAKACLMLHATSALAPYLLLPRAAHSGALQPAQRRKPARQVGARHSSQGTET